MKETLLTHAEGMEYCREIEKVLQRVCRKIEVSGSLRRECNTVHDVEIICIPMANIDLLGKAYYTADEIRTALTRIRYEGTIIKSGEKYIQVFLDKLGVTIDVFITTPNQWGVIKTIRTGSHLFSKWIVTTRQHGGAMPGNMKVKDGWLWLNKNKIPVPTEKDFFEAIKIKYVEPNKRQFAPQIASEFYIRNKK